MDMARNSGNRGGEKSWYCMEFYDEVRSYHLFSASYTTEPKATVMLEKADALAPDTTYIYYWVQDERPMTGPAGGYEGGPLAKAGK